MTIRYLTLDEITPTAVGAAYQAGHDDGLIAGPDHIALDGSPVCPWRNLAMLEDGQYLQGFADALTERAADIAALPPATGAPAGGVWTAGDAT